MVEIYECGYKNGISLGYHGDIVRLGTKVWWLRWSPWYVWYSNPSCQRIGLRKIPGKKHEFWPKSGVVQVFEPQISSTKTNFTVASRHLYVADAAQSSPEIAETCLGVPPNHAVVMDDHFRIETNGELGVSHDLRSPHLTHQGLGLMSGFGTSWKIKLVGDCIKVEPGQVFEREEPIRQGRAYRNGPWPPGWHGRRLRNLLEVFVLDISCSRHLGLVLPLSLDPACSWHFWILTALLVDSSEARDLTNSSLVTSLFLVSSMPLEADVVSAAFRWRLFPLASLSLGIFFPWDLLLLTFSSLHISFSWHGFRLAPVFLFPVKTASFDTFCLDISFVLRHFFIPTSLSFDIFVPCDAFPSTTSYYKACKKPSHSVLLHTTKLAQSASSTTSYYKACTKYFPVLLRTTKLTQSTSQYYFVLQSLHKVLPSTTSYYKACTKYFPVLLRTTTLKYFPVLLCTAKLAQNTSQHYFVLQSSHKVLPSSTSYMGTAVPEPRE